MIKTQTKIEIVTLSVPCLGHLFGLFLLLRTSFPGFNGLFQKMFFINLCLSEVLITFLAIVKRLTHADTYSTITLFQYMIGYMLMYEVMVLITLERLKTLINPGFNLKPGFHFQIIGFDDRIFCNCKF